MNLNGQAFFSTRCWNPIIPPTREHQKEEEEEGEGDGLSVGDNIPYPPPLSSCSEKFLLNPPSRLGWMDFITTSWRIVE